MKSPGDWRDHEWDDHIAWWLEEVAKGRGAVLAGAGVSMLAPSSLPSGPRLRDHVVSWVLDTSPLEAEWADIARHEGYRQLLPEVVFEDLHKILFDRMLIAFQSLRHARPNELHRSIAHLGSRFHLSIITTNFDELIDQLVGRERQVIHLHGRLSSPETLVFRLSDTSRTASRSLSDVMRAHMEGRVVAVFGYSGRDPDVMAGLGRANPAGILWVTRSPVVDVVEKKLRKMRSSIEVRVVSADLRDIARRLPRSSRKSLPKPPDIRPIERSDFDEEARAAVAARVWHRVQEFDRTIKVQMEAAGATSDAKMAAWFRREAALCCLELDDVERARRSVSLALKDAEQTGSRYVRAATVNVRGLVLMEGGKDDLEQAPEAFRTSIDLVDEFLVEDPDADRLRQTALEVKAQALNNLGWWNERCGNLKLAVDFYRQSLRLKRQIGHVMGRAITAGNLAVVYRRLGQISNSNRWRRRAEVSLVEFGMWEELTQIYRRIAEEEVKKKRPQVALRWLVLARETARHLPDHHVEHGGIRHMWSKLHSSK